MNIEYINTYIKGNLVTITLTLNKYITSTTFLNPTIFVEYSYKKGRREYNVIELQINLQKNIIQFFFVFFICMNCFGERYFNQMRVNQFFLDLLRNMKVPKTSKLVKSQNVVEPGNETFD